MAYANDLINSFLTGVRAKDFSRDAFSWQDFFNKNDARAGATQEATTYFNPLRNRALTGVNKNFAQRGLFRSGLRGADVRDTNADYDDKQQNMVERLYNIRESEKANEYNRFRTQYEDDPTGFRTSFSDIIKKYRGVA